MFIWTAGHREHTLLYSDMQSSPGYNVRWKSKVRMMSSERYCLQNKQRGIKNLYSYLSKSLKTYLEI